MEAMSQKLYKNVYINTKYTSTNIGDKLNLKINKFQIKLGSNMKR